MPVSASTETTDHDSVGPHRALVPLARLCVWSLSAAAPPRMRYGAALGLCRMAGTAYVRLRPGQARAWTLGDPPPAIALRALLTALTHHGGRFDPRLRTVGEHLISETFDQAGRLILCSGHFAMNRVMLRWLSDRGIARAVISRGDYQAEDRNRNGWVWGRPGATVTTIDAGQHSALLQARTALRSGHALLVSPETPVPRARCLPYACGAATRYLSDHIFRLAGRLRVPVLFYATRLGRDGAIDIRIEQPSVAVPVTAADIEACRLECARFIARWSGAGR
jgi:lauroyl/myristoyl acyltransferase